MKSFLWIGILCLLSGYSVNSEKIIGCYWGSWTSIAQIDIKLCTHAYFAFYTTDADGVVTTTTSPSMVSSFLALKDQNPSVKLIASIGGFNAGTTEFSAIAASPSKLSAFVSNCVALTQNFDGIDIDWEYPEPSEQQSFVNMLRELKSELSVRGKLLAIAVGAGTWRVSQSYNILDVCDTIDLLNLMSYDMQWPYTVTGTNAGYSIIDTSVSIWINGGCPANKIVLGLASYGYIYDLVKPPNNGIGAAATGASPISYRDICIKLKNPGFKHDTSDQTPYAYKAKDWISYDDITSLAAKLNIVNSWNLPGVFFWSTDLDDYDNSCGKGYFPLIRSVASALGVVSNNITTTTEDLNELTTTTEDPTQPSTATDDPNQITTTTEHPTQPSTATDDPNQITTTTEDPTVPEISTTEMSTTKTTTSAPTTESTTTTTTTAGTTIQCSVDGFFAYPGDCYKFYRCVYGIPYTFPCPSGLVWNEKAQACDWKYNVPRCA